jgi:hypothetical protein
MPTTCDISRSLFEIVGQISAILETIEGYSFESGVTL